MLRHSSKTQKRGKLRAVVLIGLLVVGVCSLLAVRPTLRGRTHSILSAHARAQLRTQVDDSQIARDRAIELRLVPGGKYPISKDDLVSAMPSDQSHLPVVKGSRAWRKVQKYLQHMQTPSFAPYSQLMQPCVSSLGDIIISP